MHHANTGCPTCHRLRAENDRLRTALMLLRAQLAQRDETLRAVATGGPWEETVDALLAGERAPAMAG